HLLFYVFFRDTSTTEIYTLSLHDALPIFQGLTSYAMYGPKNKFNNTLSDAEINAVTAQELVDRMKNLNNYEQTVIYYGPEPIKKDRKSTRLNSSHVKISYAVFCLKKKKKK